MGVSQVSLPQRGRALAAREAHYLKAGGSIPSPVTLI